jgi:DNA-binding transcriptional MerR regulator
MMRITEGFVQIGEVAKSLGITPRTIRYYEELGIMRVPLREAGSRQYSNQDIVRLKFILKLKELGITLREMQELAEHYDLNDQDRDQIMPQLLELMDAHLNKVDTKISRLASLRDDIVTYRSKVVGILNYSNAGNL